MKRKRRINYSFSLERKSGHVAAAPAPASDARKRILVVDRPKGISGQPASRGGAVVAFLSDFFDVDTYEHLDERVIDLFSHAAGSRPYSDLVTHLPFEGGYAHSFQLLAVIKERWNIPIIVYIGAAPMDVASAYNGAADAVVHRTFDEEKDAALIFVYLQSSLILLASPAGVGTGVPVSMPTGRPAFPWEVANRPLTAEESAASETPEKLARKLTILNALGLHPAPAMYFVKAIESFKNDTTVSFSVEGEEVNGYGIMGLMMLAAGPGTEVLVKAEGLHARAAIARITSLVNEGFYTGEACLPIPASHCESIAQ